MDGRDIGGISLAELAQRSGLPMRTLRFYIAQGLLPGPDKAGRYASYGPRHFARLDEIRRLSQQGLTLAEIARRSGAAATFPPESRTVAVYEVAAGVSVLVRDGLSPWRLREVHRAIASMAAGLAENPVSMAAEPPAPYGTDP